MGYKNIHVIINPASGQPEPVLHTLNKVFHDHGVEWHVSLTSKLGDGIRLAQEAVQAGADVVVSYGGDGTVTEVVNGLTDSDIPLGILHGGTGNAMAYKLGIPADLTEAAELIVGEHQLKSVDLGKVFCGNNPDVTGHFILRSSIGLQNVLLDKATQELKGQFGNLAYVMAGLQSLAESKPMTYKITVDGEEVTGEGLSCMVTNAATVGGRNSFDFAPGVDPGDGLLDVFVLDSRFESLISMLGSNIGKDLDQFPQHWRGKEIILEADPPQKVTLDGEEFGETPITATVIPGTIQVIVPLDEK